MAANKKLKTHKGLMSRVKITKTGKVMHRRAGGRHLMGGKSAKKNREQHRWRALTKGEVRHLKRQLNLST